MMREKIKVVGIAGSLREKSYNRAALRAAKKLAPDNIEVEVFDRMADIPPYNQDRENDLPEAVVKLKKMVKAADGVLFVSPEYNYSVSGVLKNAFDWASRPYGKSAWTGKPAAIMGASSGMLGTARMQYHFRQVVVHESMPAVVESEVMIPHSADKFNERLELTDEKTKEKIVELLNALADLIKLYSQAD